MSEFLSQITNVLKDRKLMVEISLWGLFWSVAMSLSVGIFGHVPALLTIAGLAMFTSYIWYRTGKRDVRQMEVARIRNNDRRG